MSKLDDLIAELCPNGVEYKKIKDVYNRLKGTSITAGKMKEIENPDGEIKIFAGGKTLINAREEDIHKANITIIYNSNTLRNLYFCLFCEVHIFHLFFG